jgi:hypothetical protein
MCGLCVVYGDEGIQLSKSIDSLFIVYTINERKGEIMHHFELKD